MTTPSIEASIFVIQEQLKNITDEMRDARSARKAQYEQTEQQNLTLLKIEHRLEKVEAFVTESRPTLQEYRELKLKVQGAGTLGRWLYVGVGAMIGAIAAATAYWQKWIGH